ncbi:MAG: hypothetical protein EXS38_07375 [Opitutus sp.]|nr:hypothetical protein [Opitutus sp.]
MQDFKTALEQMSAVERAQVAGHLRILRWKETPDLADELARAHAAMDAGRKVPQERVEQFVASQRVEKK